MPDSKNIISLSKIWQQKAYDAALRTPGGIRSHTDVVSNVAVSVVLKYLVERISHLEIEASDAARNYHLNGDSAAYERWTGRVAAYERVLAELTLLGPTEVTDEA